MRVLVTGAAGFIGSHLVERLLDTGHQVIGVDNFDAFYDPAVKERNLEKARDHVAFTELRGDVRDPAALERLPDGIDTVVHLAARAGVRPSIEDPALYMDVNLGGTMRVLEFMRQRGVPRLLFGSSSSVYGDAERVPFVESRPADRPISPYASTKRSGELMVHAHAHLYGIDAVCLRFFTVYGPRQRPDLAIHKFAELMVRDAAIPMYGDGSSERDYTYVDDIVDGVEGALRYLRDHRGAYEIVNLGGARTVPLRLMIDRLGEALDVTPRIRRMDMQPGDVRRTYADVTKAQRLFDYRPSTSFDDGIERFATWFLSRSASAPKRLAAV